MLVLALPLGIMSCSTDDPVPETEQPVTPGDDDTPDEPDDNTGSEDVPEGPGNNDNNNDSNDPMNNHLKITVGGISFNATLEENATAAAFKALLPMTINMSEMNGNEKYYYLPGSLPAAASNPGTIREGDLMLYGSSCIVLFYKTFSTSYSYTRLGRMDDVSGLASALGSGSASVTFSL